MKKQRVQNYVLKGVFLFLVVVSVWGMNAAVPVGSGAWQYTANGKEFLKQGPFEKIEGFSYAYQEQTGPGTWLYDIFSYSVFSIFGGENIYVIRFIFIMFLFAALFMTVYKRQQGRYISIILPAALTGFYLLVLRVGMTPETLSYIFLVYVIYILEHQPRRIYLNLYYLLPFIVLLWANIHNSAVIAAFLAVIYFFYHFSESRAINEKRPAYKFKPMILSCLGVFAAVVLNPMFYNAPLEFIRELISGPLYGGYDYADTHRSVYYGFFYTYIFILAAAVLYDIKGADVGRKNGLFKDLFILIIFAGMTVKNSGYIPYFLAASIPIVSYYIYLIFKWEIVWTRQWNEMDMLKIKNPLYIIMCICMLGASAFFFIKGEKNPGPEKALKYISGNPVPENIFHPHKWGGYMEFYLYPEYKTMTAPGRNVPQETMNEYEIIREMSEGAPELIKKYGINTFMFPVDEKEIILKLKKIGYKTAYFDGSTVIMTDSGKTDRYFKNIRPFDSEKIYDSNNPDDALEELSVFLEKYPSVKGYMMIARLYGEKNISDRIIFLEDIVETTDDEELMKELTRAYIEAGEYEAAAGIVREISFFDREARGILKEARKMRRREERPVEDE